MPSSTDTIMERYELDQGDINLGTYINDKKVIAILGKDILQGKVGIWILLEGEDNYSFYQPNKKEEVTHEHIIGLLGKTEILGQQINYIELADTRDMSWLEKLEKIIFTKNHIHKIRFYTQDGEILKADGKAVIKIGEEKIFMKAPIQYVQLEGESIEKFYTSGMILKADGKAIVKIGEEIVLDGKNMQWCTLEGEPLEKIYFNGEILKIDGKAIVEIKEMVQFGEIFIQKVRLEGENLYKFESNFKLIKIGEQELVEIGNSISINDAPAQWIKVSGDIGWKLYQNGAIIQENLEGKRILELGNLSSFMNKSAQFLKLEEPETSVFKNFSTKIVSKYRGDTMQESIQLFQNNGLVKIDGKAIIYVGKELLWEGKPAQMFGLYGENQQVLCQDGMIVKVYNKAIVRIEENTEWKGKPATWIKLKGDDGWEIYQSGMIVLTKIEGHLITDVGITKQLFGSLARLIKIEGDPSWKIYHNGTIREVKYGNIPLFPLHPETDIFPMVDKSGKIILSKEKYIEAVERSEKKAEENS